MGKFLKYGLFSTVKTIFVFAMLGDGLRVVFAQELSLRGLLEIRLVGDGCGLLNGSVDDKLAKIVECF